MIVYFGIFFILSAMALSVKGKNNQQLMLWFLFPFFLFFAGTRLNTGCDFWGYLQRFYQSGTFDTSGPVWEMEEAGFQFIMLSIKSYNLDYMWLNFSCSLIIFICLFKFIRRHPTPLLVLALMFPILIVQLSMSGLRQALAVAFLMLAMTAFIDKKRMMTAFWIIIGASFHQSLIIFLPLAFLVGSKVSTKKIIIALLIIGPISAIFLSARMDVYSNRYITGDAESAGAILRLGLILISAILFEVYKKRIHNMFPQEYDLMRLFSLISFALIPVALVSSVAVHRLGYYVLPVSYFTLAIVPFVLSNSIKNIQFYRLMPVLLYGAYILVWFGTSRHAQMCYVPYDSYLF
jgi:hypothetical protein